MKKVQISLVAAAVFGIGSAYAFAHKDVNNPIFAVKISSSPVTYSYYNSASGLGNCHLNTGTVCSFTSTATASYFNSHNSGTFPPNNGTSPVVNWGSNTDQIHLGS